jgi:4-hydroxy-tetrahydrodipicolinate synthase
MIYPKGIIPAVPAIFSDTDQILKDEVGNVVSFLSKAKCNGFALNLIGGEFYKLSEREMEEMLKVGVDLAGAGMLVCAGISAPGTTEACRMAKIASDIGVDCLIVMPPYYNPTGVYSRRAIMDHFGSIAKCTDLPFVIQDFNYGIPLGVLSGLKKEFSNFSGLKIEGRRSNQVLGRIRKIRSEMGNDFSILGGMLGSNMVNEIASGASGSIPGCSLADFVSKEYISAIKGSSVNHALHEILKSILKTESQKLKYFVYIEKAILKHRGIIEHTACRKPYDYPTRELMDGIMADVDRLVSG